MAMQIYTLKHLTVHYPWLHRLQKLQKLHSLASLSHSSLTQDHSQQQQQDYQLERTKKNQETKLNSNRNKNKKDSIELNVDSTKSTLYFPKRGQSLELVCESLAFKGKGVCKVADTGFIVMCDRALPGERFIGRITRRKGSYAEVGFQFLLSFL